MKLTYSADELAAALGKSPATVRSRHTVWSREHGFPRPLPGMGAVWSKAQVDSWISSNGFSSPVEASKTSSQIADAGYLLDAAYGRASHGR